VCYEHPPIASLLIGAAQEADLVSPGFKQSTAISNRSTLDFTLHYDEQRIVLPGDASWKWLCSSSVPPDDNEAYAWPFSVFTKKTGFWPLYCQISTDLDKILHTPIVV